MGKNRYGRVWALPAVLALFIGSATVACSNTNQTGFPIGVGTYPWSGSEKTSAWAEQLLGEVVTFKAMADNGVIRGNFEPYVEKMLTAREAYRAGDRQTTYNTVNQFMTMLEARVGEIDPHAADSIWNACYRWTPDQYHARDRHVRAVGKEELHRLEEFMRYQDEKASHSF